MPDPRSYLFVPGNRSDRFTKASGSGADRIILDLEDAVGAGFKDDARDLVARWFAGGGSGMVRINGADTPWFDDDIAWIARVSGAAVMVPKSNADSLSLVSERLPGRPLVALIETVEGLCGLREAARVKGVGRLAFGNIDFGSDARIPGSGEALDPARFEIVLASRLAGLPPPIDGVTAAIDDEESLASDISRARAMGFTAKLCIHPRQIDAVARGFAPTDLEMDWARRVMQVLEGAGGSVAQMDGKMVDRPMADRARTILGSLSAADLERPPAARN